MLVTLCVLWTASAARAQSPESVLVVCNGRSPASLALADYYMLKRGIPARNRLLLYWEANENADRCSLTYFTKGMAEPIYARIAALGNIDYIVLCRNLPIRINETGGSVDSALAGRGTTKRFNPYFGKGTPFSAATYGMYLVTRLDGWSWADAMALVDRSLAAAPGGPFQMDCDPSKNSNYSYYLFNYYMTRASSVLTTKGFAALLDSTSAFVAPSRPVAGYVSWGSNDANFSAAAYNSITFLLGALAETAVSTSASNLRYPGGSQSQIATLIRNGVTGVKGYVTEPYVDATARADGLFYLYTMGRNLAESFYGASRYLGWKDVVVGDPLCAPYAPKK